MGPNKAEDSQTAVIAFKGIACLSQYGAAFGCGAGEIGQGSGKSHGG